MSTDMPLAANQPPFPDYLKKEASPKNAEAFGQVLRSDLGVSRLSLGQGETPSVKDGSVPLGAMFLSLTKKVVKPGTPFIVLKREKIYYKFKNRNPKLGREIEFITKDPNDPRILKINGLDFREEEDGKKVPPIVTEFLNFYILLPKGLAEEPVLLSFKRSSLPAGRAFTQKLLRILPNTEYPIYSALFMFGPPTRDKNDNYAFNILPNGFLPEDKLQRAKDASILAKSMADFAMEATILHEEEGDPKETETSPVSQTNRPEDDRPLIPPLPAFLAPLAPQQQAQAAANAISAMPNGSSQIPETAFENIPF